MNIAICSFQNQLGDLNQDGNIDVIDVQRLVSIILSNPPPPTEVELLQAELNYDENINILDVITLVDAILNKGHD